MNQIGYLIALLAALVALSLVGLRQARVAIATFDRSTTVDRSARVLAGERAIARMFLVALAATLIGIAVAIAFMRDEAQLTKGFLVLVIYLPLTTVLGALPAIRFRAHVLGVRCDARLVAGLFRVRAAMAVMAIAATAILIALGSATAARASNWVAPVAVAMAAAVALVALIGQLRPTLLRLLYRARRLERPDAQQGLDWLRQQATVARIDVWVLPSPLRSANAHATGLSTGHPQVFITDFIVDGTSSDELVAIVAHEVAHARSGHIRQTLYRTALSIVASMAAFLAVLALWTTLRPRSHELTSILVAAVTSALLIHFTVDRSRKPRDNEFEADALAARWVGAEAVGRALQRVYDSTLASDDPRRARRLRASHPALAERLAHLGQVEGRSAH